MYFTGSPPEKAEYFVDFYKYAKEYLKENFKDIQDRHDRAEVLSIDLEG